MRPAALLLFGALVWLAWSQQAPALPESTFEASRQGVVPVNYPGPYTYPDFVRLLVRRTGPFRLDVTRDLRVAAHAGAEPVGSPASRGPQTGGRR